MELDIKKTVKVTAKTLKIHMKVTDRFSCDLLDQDGEVICQQEDGYVPNFMPDSFGGDYLELHIDLDTGAITNWRKREDDLRDWVNDMNKMADEQND